MATWIKFSTNTFDDEKIKIIENMKEGHTMILFWIKMLSLAGKHETYGEINYTVEELSLLFNFSVIKIEKYLDVFNKFSMISHQNYNEIFINNFMKYQDFEKLRKQKEQTNIRVKRYRENKKDENVTRYNTVTEPLQERYSNADETQQSKNKIEIKKEIKEDDDDNNIIQCIKEGQNPSSSSSKQDLILLGLGIQKKLDPNIKVIIDRFNKLPANAITPYKLERVNPQLERDILTILSKGEDYINTLFKNFEESDYLSCRLNEKNPKMEMTLFNFCKEETADKIVTGFYNQKAKKISDSKKPKQLTAQEQWIIKCGGDRLDELV